MHRYFGVCVVYGWDVTCQASDSWIDAHDIRRLFNGVVMAYEAEASDSSAEAKSVDKEPKSPPSRLRQRGTSALTASGTEASNCRRAMPK